MEQRHPGTLDKVWLALTSFQEAKALMVQDYGIGEDMPMTLYGWDDDRLVLICRVISNPKISREHRIGAIFYAAETMRSTWAVTGFTLMNEGFCVLPGQSVDSATQLPEHFANGNAAVAECLTAVHVEEDHHLFVATPYRYRPGRLMGFGDAIFFEPGPSAVLPVKFREILSDVPVEMLDGDSYEAKMRKSEEMALYGVEAIWV